MTPAGHGFLALGVNHAAVLRSTKLVDYPSTVFHERFGRDWEKVYAQIARLNRDRGFNSGGYDAPPELTLPLVARV